MPVAMNVAVTAMPAPVVPVTPADLDRHRVGLLDGRAARESWRECCGVRLRRESEAGSGKRERGCHKCLLHVSSPEMRRQRDGEAIGSLSADSAFIPSRLRRLASE
jgi:hypothetical protein